MAQSTRKPKGLAIGMDLGDKRTFFHIREKNRVFGEGSIKTTPGEVRRFLKRFGPSLVAFEVGTHSPWILEIAEELGHKVVVANPRRLRLISENDRKTDQADAKYLSSLGQLNPELLAPVKHITPQARADLGVLDARSALVKVRGQLIGVCRGKVKPFGARLPTCSPESFSKKALEGIPEVLKPALMPLLGIIQEMTQAIKAYDREIGKIGEENYPEVAHLQQIPGVGPLTATTFVLKVGDPGRFRRSRKLGAYIGLVPKLDQSGDRNPQLGITKAGSPTLRRLLVQAAHYILGPFGQDSDLRRYGLSLAERGGKTGKKRAVIAVARKLATVLHRMMVTGEDYAPYYNSKRLGKKKKRKEPRRGRKKGKSRAI